MMNTKEHIIKIGRAMLALGLQNTHCGNISVREGDEFYITKTGSMKGHLEERDIVLPGLDEPKTGLFQASSETGTHREILRYAKAAMHAHSLPATLISYTTDTIEPLDFLGKSYLRSVPVAAFEYPVGSKEMEEEIPNRLRQASAVVVKTHGPFVRGNSLNEAFFNLCIVDYSSEILLNMAMLGVDRSRVQELHYPHSKVYKEPKDFKATKDGELIRQFKRTASDIFTMKLSPFHTGSLSVEDGNEMLFASAVSSPETFENEIVRKKIEEEEDDFFKNLHRAVYTHSSAKSAILTHSPYAMIQSFCMLSKGMDRIVPIDAEGGYLYPAVPVVLPDTDMKSIIRKAEKYKMVVLAGLGVLAVGHTPGHTIHHVSSLKNICYLKTQLELMERVGVVKDADAYLDERGKKW